LRISPCWGDSVYLSYCRRQDELSKVVVELAGLINYVTQSGVNGPGVTALFVSQPNPKEYLDTVVYFDHDAELRHEESFGRFVFYMFLSIIAKKVISESLYNMK